MTTPSSAATSEPGLSRNWQQLRSEPPGLRARDAAARLRVSEAELTASRLSTDTVRLRPEWAALLPLSVSAPNWTCNPCRKPRRRDLMRTSTHKHCIQIHSGPVSNLRWMDTWFNVLDPLFNLHLKTTGVTELWRVRKPSVDGIVTSYEGFDADGERVILLFGVRKPGVPEREDWRALPESASPLVVQGDN